MIYKLNIWKKQNNTISYKNPIIVNNREQLIKIVKENRNNFFEDTFDIHNHNNNLLEYCVDNKYVKLWFDIDMIKIEINDLQNALTELFDLIDEVVGKKLNRNSYYIYYKKLPNKSYTHSLRIINWYYKISYEDNENLSRTLTEHNKSNILSKNLDYKVYHKERQIQLPYNSKITSDKYEKHKNIYGDLKTNDSNSHLFVDYNYKQNDKTKPQTINVLNYLISYIGNCKEELIFTTNIIQEQKKEMLIEDDNEVNYRNREKKLLYTEDIINTLINYLDTKFYTAKYSKKWIGLLKILKPLNLQDIQKYLLHSVENADKLDYTIDRNNELYSNLNYNATDDNFIIKSYTNHIDIVCKYLNNFQDKYEFYTLNFSSIINDLYDWLCNKTKIEPKNIYDVLQKYKDYNEIDFKKIKYIIKITDAISYNYKTGYLYGLEELYNYYVENQYYNMFLSNDNNNNFNIVEDKLIINNELNNNILNEVNKFIDYETTLMVMEMKWGTGKTYHISKRILKSIFESDGNKSINDYLKHIEINDINSYLNFNDSSIPYYQELRNLKRQIIISPNNSLNIKEQQELLKEDGNCFTNHISIIKLKDEIKLLYDKFNKKQTTELEDKLKVLKCKKRIMCRYLNVITSLQSIDNIEINDYNINTSSYEVNEDSVDTIYLDEFNTLMNNFNLNGKTFKGKKLNEEDIYIQKIEYNMNYLIKLCKIAKRIIILDADINFMKLNWFLKKIGKYNAKKVKVNYNKFTEENYKLNVYDTECSLEEQLLKPSNKNREICCVSKNKAIDIFKSLICECFDKDYNLIKKDKIIGLLDGDGFNYFNSNDIKQSILSKKLFEYTEIDKDELSQSNRELIKCEVDCKFLKIVESKNLKWCDDKLAEQKKDELLYEYEECITNIYKFTDFIRTPTIKCGISFNSCYFNEVYVFIYIGILNVEEIIQMFWRSRNTIDKILHICFTNNQNIRKYDNLINYNWVSDKIDIQSYNPLSSDKYLTKYNEEDYDRLKSNNLRELIKLNEYDAVNSSNRFTQLFFNLLFYHGFKLREHIFFKTRERTNDIISQNKTHRIELQHNTFVNTEILDLSKDKLNDIDYKKKNNMKLNNDYRNKHNKYLKLNSFLHFEPLFIYFWLMNEYEDYKKELIKCRDETINELEDLDEELNEEDIRDKNELLIKYNTKLDLIQRIEDSNILQIIQLQNKEIYNNIINTTDFYSKYGLENHNSSIISSYSQIKRLLKSSNETEETEYNSKNSINEDIKIKRDKLLRTLLLFLGVNIKEDYNKECLKRYILNNDKSKIRLCGFVNDILSNTNIKEFDGESICFLLWLDKWVLEEYKKTNINTKIKVKKLDAIKHLGLIKKIINHYLNDLNLEFDYENQNDNTGKLYNNLQFVIKKQYNIKILNEPIFNKYYYGNEKIVKEINNGEAITYKKDFNNINLIKMKKREQIIFYKEIDDIEIINDNIILKPLSIIKEKEVYKIKTKNRVKVKKHYDNNIELIKQEYTSYNDVNNKSIKYRYINKLVEDKINKIDNYINRNTKINTKMILNSSHITDNIMKNGSDSNEIKDILDNIVSQVIINNELEHIDLNSKDSIKTINKKSKLLNDIVRVNEPPPIIIDNKINYIDKFLDNISQIIAVN